MRSEPLPFDPIERATEQWRLRWPQADRMRAATSIMRVHQLVLSQLDEILRPLQLSFARYEVLVLLSFSRRGELPLGKIGERLQVHATSVTPLVQRLVQDGYVARRRHPDDGRAVLASITEAGRQAVEQATTAITEAEFGLAGLSIDSCDELSQTLTQVRRQAGDFV